MNSARNLSSAASFVWGDVADRCLVEEAAAHGRSALLLSLFTPPGRRYRERIITSVPISRPFIRRNFSGIRRIAGSDRSRCGGPAGFCFRRRFLIFGRPADCG